MGIPYRQIHLDFHTSPHIPDVAADFDEETFARTLKNAHVQSVNLFAKCHHGYFYYPTQVGEMHPGLRVPDLLDRQVAACRRHGIGVTVYTCVGWNERASERFPQWMQVDKAGRLGCVEPLANYYYKWHAMCVGNPDYCDYIEREVEEEILRFHPDAMWLDIITSFGCVCPSCLSDMRAKGLDPANPEDLRRHDKQNEIAFMHRIHDFIHRIDPSVKVFFNGGAAEPDNAAEKEIAGNRRREALDYVDIESLPGGYWGYTHFPIAANYLNHKPLELTMMNGKFHLSWGDFGSLRNKEALEYECFRGLALGTHVCIGDQMHPRGMLNETTYLRLGQVLERVEALEPWCEGTKKQADIAVMLTNEPIAPPDLPEEGAYRIFTELHQPVDFADLEDDLEGYRLLVLPDRLRLNKRQAEKIQRFIDSGRPCLITGSSGLDDGGQQVLQFGVDMAMPAEYAPRYLRYTQDRFPNIPPMDYVYYDQGQRIRLTEEGEVITPAVDPYFNRSYDRFCSHRQTPPDRLSGEAAIVRVGQTVYCAQPLFGEYARYGNRLCKDTVQALLERYLLPQPLVQTNLPGYAEVSVRSRGSEWMVHILNYIIQKKSRDTDTIEESVPLYDRYIRIRIDRQPRAVVFRPSGESVPFSYDGRYVELRPAVLHGYELIHIIC